MCDHRFDHVLNSVGVRYVCLFEGMDWNVQKTREYSYPLGEK